MHIFETEFPQDYRRKEIGQILNFVKSGKFCQLISIPGAGKATVLKTLAHNREVLKFHLGEKERNTRVFYLNLDDLSNFSDFEIAKFILIAMEIKPQSQTDPLILKKQLRETVNKMADRSPYIIFLFDHFDEYQNRLPRSFFQLLKNIKGVAKYKFSVIFGTRRDLLELTDEEISRDYWDFFVGNTVYLKVFDNSAVEFLYVQMENVFGKKLNDSQKREITKLCTGHAKLTKIAAELALSQNEKITKDTLLKNPQIQGSLYEIWLFLTSQEQGLLQQFATQKLTEINSETEKAVANLINFDLLKAIKQNENITIQQHNLSLTIPLFEEFIKSTNFDFHQKITFVSGSNKIQKGNQDISELLSPQEYRLLKYLIENEDKIIDREEIISVVWPQTQVNDAISDEAIDQMVFRLRKKIEEEPKNPKYLTTIKGRGLKFTS